MSYGPAGPDVEDFSQEDVLRVMFPAIVHRGRDAWGYMYYNDGDDAIEFFKSAGSCKMSGADDDMVVDGNATRWIVGHVRAATNGTPQNTNNNHPILHHNIVGVHNGVIRNHKEIFKTVQREFKDAEVDSEAIFAAINAYGVNSGLKKIYGDMVAVFADVRRPAGLRIARTDGRPLVYVRTKTGAMVFASEERVIKALVKPETMDGSIIHMFVENTVWGVRDGKITARKTFRQPEPKKYASQSWSSSPSVIGGTSNPMMKNYGEKDRWGGRYVGGNRWMTPKGSMLDPEKYIDWCWEQNQAEKSAFNEITADLPDSEASALAVVNNNGNL